MYYNILPDLPMTDIKLITAVVFSTDFKWSLHIISTMVNQKAGICDNEHACHPVLVSLDHVSIPDNQT